jgi:hypothetical protein
MLAVPAFAGVTVFQLHDHPNGAVNPPSYGLRIDDLLASGEYTFSFDYVDGDGAASVTLTYDDVLGTIRIMGRAYGGRDIGGSWDASARGWVDLDFLYDTSVSERDNCAGAAGNDVYVTGMSATNGGTVTLDGWGGSGVHAFTDKADGSGCTFTFDNDSDSKGNATIAGDPSIWSGNGWLMPVTSGSRDWLFIGEMMALPVEDASWGGVKTLYR